MILFVSVSIMVRTLLHNIQVFWQPIESVSGETAISVLTVYYLTEIHASFIWRTLYLGSDLTWRFIYTTFCFMDAYAFWCTSGKFPKRSEKPVWGRLWRSDHTGCLCAEMKGQRHAGTVREQHKTSWQTGTLLGTRRVGIQPSHAEEPSNKQHRQSEPGATATFANAARSPQLCHTGAFTVNNEII